MFEAVHPHSELGRLRPFDVQRNPVVWREQCSGGAQAPIQLENLVQTLPERRHPALLELEQLSLLDRDLQKHFLWPEDLALARVSDSQGLGGHSEIRPLT